MAAESVDAFLIPEKHEDGVNTRKSRARHSVSPSRPIAHARNLRASYHAGDSNEKSGSANRKNVVPHYLRASTGSCHDFCKHGKKHSFEEKARKPLQKKIATPLLNQQPVLIMVSGEKKEKEFNQVSSTNTEKHSPDFNLSPEIISHSPKPKKSLENVVKKDPLIDTKKNHSPPDKKTYLRKAESTSSSGNKPILSTSKPLSTKKCPLPDPPEIVKSVFFPSKKDEDPVKQASSACYKMPKAAKKTTFPSKKSTSSPVKPKPLEAKLFSSSSLDYSDSGCGKGRKNIVSNMARNMTMSKASTKKVSAPKLPITGTADSNSRATGNVKSVSQSKDINRIVKRVDKTKRTDNEKVPEKILHIIQTGSSNDPIGPISSLPSPTSIAPLSHENSSLFSSYEENSEVTRRGINGEANENGIPEKKETPKKMRVVNSEDRIRTPVNLKFRNGKVLEVQSNSNSPMRLRFRRARVIGSNERRSDLRRIIFKKGAVNIDNKSAEGTSSEKIVLKHQEVHQGKKDGQGLLNNVIIEQTASKLVKSRKSKVKALVGAFETVISLQESRRS